jgi:hypothetical protein
MATMSTPRDEERVARKKQRDLDKLHEGAAKAREHEQGTKLAGVIRDELARNRSCRCPITPRSTLNEIMALGAGCTAGLHGHGGYICPTLDAIRRRMGR